MKHNQQKLRPSPKRNGFTLVELLVVIAIIALLAAILFPVFAKAQENARRTACQSNMKQLGLGLMQYSQDYGETLPTNATPPSGMGSKAGDVWDYANISTTNWITAAQPYIKSWQVFKCPSAVSLAFTGANAVYNPISAPNPSNTGYLTNVVLVERKLSALQNTASLIWVHEAPWGSSHIFKRPANTGPLTLPVRATDTLQDWLTTGQNYDTMHFDGGNLLFADGHVKWRKKSSISAREIGLNRDEKGENALTSTIDTNQVGAS